MVCFGSGIGVTADYFAKNNMVTAIEPSEESVIERWQNNEYRQIVGSTEQLRKIDDETFDLIICHNVLEYVSFPINYGYVEGIMAPDGEEQDAYILGIDVPVDVFTGKIIAVVHRNDDIEEKWVVCLDNMNYSEEEIRNQIDFQEKYFDSYIRME